MHQILFRLPEFLPGIGGAPIYGYGVMLVIGFFAAMELAKFLARRSRIDPEVFANAALIALVAGVVGARVSHVLENIGDYTRSDLSFTENLWNAINLRSGGLTYYGGFLLAFAAVLAYGFYKRVPIRVGMDIIAPCLMIGLGFGRIGCYLNGCCYGAETNVGWAVQFPYHSDAYLEQAHNGEIRVPADLLDRNGQPMSIDQIKADKTISPEQRQHLLDEAAQQHALAVHPAELYSTLTAWLIAAFLLAYFTMPHAPGRVFALMLIVEGISRFLLEEVRAEPVFTPFGKHIFGTMSYSMVLSIPLVILGIILWIVFGRMAKHGVETGVGAPVAAGA
ncbi:MAG TPA: prolipoprotein diacylglyceryl transferase [Tepidisphaeraceae bacterium]|jgi:phosphatidylglycerol:prolipoprotein diacylglycerol transferase